MSGYKVWVDDGNGGNIANLIWDGGTKASTLYYSWQPVFSDGSVALLAGHTYRFQVGKWWSLERFISFYGCAELSHEFNEFRLI